MIKQTTVAALTAAAALTLPAVAGAHVTMQPGHVPAGSFTKVDVRVPNERDNRGTVKVVLKLPDGFHFLSYQKVPGWRVARVPGEARHAGRPRRLLGRRAVHPRRVAGPQRAATGSRPASSRTSRCRSARRRRARYGGLVPRVQTYQGGEVVRWAGAPDADQPAPRITLTATEEH